MKILIHPTYFPPIVQMVAVAQANHVVFEVCDNYQKQSYRTRTYIAHCNGKLLLNIPVLHSKNGIRQKYKEVQVENSFPWQSQHWKSLQSAYRTSPYFEYYEDDLKPLFFEPVNSILDFNLKTFKTLCEFMELHIKISKTINYETNPEISDFRYLSNSKIKTSFSLQKYTQVFNSKHNFISNLSTLDLLFNEGPNALHYLESQKIF